jgi:hypothetical protein
MDSPLDAPGQDENLGHLQDLIDALQSGADVSGLPGKELFELGHPPDVGAVSLS